MEFSERIKRLRLDNGYSQTDLAKELYVTRQAISKWERGLGKPDHEVLKQISCFFDISIDDLLNQETDLSLSLHQKQIETDSTDLSENTDFSSDTYIPIKPDKNKTQKITELCQISWGFLKSIDSDILYIGLIALFPAILRPFFLFITFPMAFMSFHYSKKKLFYTVSLLTSILLFSFAAYGYMGEKFGWFTNVEIIPLESEIPEDEEQSNTVIIEDISE